MSPAAFHRAILRSAAMLVPESQRAEWLAEWRSELWHVRRDPHGRSVAAFCMGAFRDAWWMRGNGPGLGSGGFLQLNVPAPAAFIETFPDAGVPVLSSPVHCLSILAALGVLCAAIAFLLPGARSVLLGTLYPRNLVMLSPAEEGDPGIPNGLLDPYPSVSLAQFESLKASSGGQFTGLAFHAPAPVAGRWNLPARVDAWLVEDESALRALPASTEGFVVGRLRYDDLHDSRFHFIRLCDRSFEMFWVVLPAFLVGCILLRFMPYDSPGGHLRRTGPRRGLFLVAKTLLVLPIVLFGSLDLGSLGGSLSPLFFDVAVFGSLFAVRWIIADQRKRCPVCLRLLANPVRIGESSRILLEWHGTELMCLSGHGMLYVQEWPAIWPGRQRWMGLGTSWGGLFP
jgi:hypothetical protein